MISASYSLTIDEFSTISVSILDLLISEISLGHPSLSGRVTRVLHSPPASQQHLAHTFTVEVQIVNWNWTNRPDITQSNLESSYLAYAGISMHSFIWI